MNEREFLFDYVKFFIENEVSLEGDFYHNRLTSLLASFSKRGFDFQKIYKSHKFLFMLLKEKEDKGEETILNFLSSLTEGMNESQKVGMIFVFRKLGFSLNDYKFIDQDCWKLVKNYWIESDARTDSIEEYIQFINFVVKFLKKHDQEGGHVKEESRILDDLLQIFKPTLVNRKEFSFDDQKYFENMKTKEGFALNRFFEWSELLNSNNEYILKNFIKNILYDLSKQIKDGKLYHFFYRFMISAKKKCKKVKGKRQSSTRWG